MNSNENNEQVCKVNLKTYSHYSIGESIIKIDELIQHAINNQCKFVAIADRMNLFGAYEFISSAINAGIKPILRCNVKIENIGYITLYIKNQIGYESLSKILSYAYIKETGHISLQDLSKITDCICLSGEACIRLNDEKLMENNLKILRNIFLSDLYVEIQDKNHHIYNVAHKLNIPIVYTRDAFYLKTDDLEKFYISKAVHEKTRYDSSLLNNSPNNTIFFTPPINDMEGVVNINNICMKCNFNFAKASLILPKYSDNQNSMLRNMVYDGLNQIQLTDEERLIYEERLEYELSILESKGFVGYFLITADFIKYAIQKNVPVGPGRGSAAGSLVSYCLNITKVDPIKFNLIFERFLNPERSEPPDIDIDFCPERREEVENYIIEKYGKHNVANIAAFGLLHARSAIRDVFRAKNFSFFEFDAISKLIPQDQINQVTLSQAISIIPKLQEFYQSEKYGPSMKIAEGLTGIVRSTSIHPSGIVLTDQPVFKYIPLFRSENKLITQFDMRSVGAVGCIKFDFLGLSTLTIISKTVQLIHERHGKYINIDNIPYDDPSTIAIFNDLYLTCIFQFENAGIRDVLQRYGIKTLRNLIALNALWRPGPISSIPTFFKNMNNQTQIPYLHPLLESILQETYGVFVYQEQVMSASRILANYTLAEADLLRRAMGKKKHEEMQKHRKIFVDNAMTNGVEEKIAHKIFDEMAEFSGYGFNKAHSTVYSIIAYQCAYLKAHGCIEFITTCLNYEYQDPVKLIMLIDEAKRKNIEILPPCINKSKYDFSIEGNNCIRYGLKALKNMGESSGKTIESNRPYSSVGDFLYKNSGVINQKNWDAVVYSGSLDILGRREDFMIPYLDVLSGTEFEKNRPNIGLLNKLNKENKCFGFYFNHPSLYFSKLISNITCIKDININKNQITVFGEAISVSFRRNKNSKSYAFIKLTDHTGIADITVFTDILNQSTDKMKEGSLLYIKCNTSFANGNMKITAHEIMFLNDYLKECTTGISITINSIVDLDKLKNIINNHHGDKKIKIITPEEDIMIPQTICISDQSLSDLWEYEIHVF